MRSSSGVRMIKTFKVTVEVRDGQVFVNGKPVSEFDDSNLSVRKRKVMIGKNLFFSVR